MATIGVIGLLVAFAGVAVSVVCLLAGALLARKRSGGIGETLTWGGHIGVILSAVALTFCCGILVFCFMTGDMSIEYVLRQHSDASGELAWLYKLSGLWAGREGSLLFWAWLIAAFNAVVAVRNLKSPRKLDSMALLVSQLVLAAFVGVLLLSESNMPFTATPLKYFNSDGTLTSSASMLGMNTLLEHWAMAIHPPTLFIGYAGLTIPFAYAIAALIVNDSSKEWVVRSQRYTLFSWFFLGVGIGLGAVWAYVVLGWGGYWGWDPVENASLLSWLVGVALIHSFTVYRQRGAFKRWSVMCACLTFAFVIVGTFIARSGLVQSVHAFEGDPVSLVLFGALIVLSVVAGIVGLVIRWKSFGPGASGSDDVENMLSKDAAYYFNNVIMVVFATLLAYLTIASALPGWMPFGGQAISAGTYNAIARPLGIVYLAILAICPLLSWGKTDGKQFWKRARVPAVCALVLFAVLMVYFVTYLVPSYNAVIAAGGINAEGLMEEGPAWYYNGLAAVGLLVASLLFFNSLFMLGRAVRGYQKGHGGNPVSAAFGMLVNRASTFGGFVAHFGMAVILVGLIGSSMYVTEKVAYVGYDEATDTASEDFVVKDYTLKYTGNEIVPQDNKDDILYTVHFDAYKDGQFVGSVDPTVQFVQSTQQQKLVASVISFPTEDLFVVYRGVNENGDFSMDVRVNPLISQVWIGFFLLMAGVLIATAGKRGASRKLTGADAAASMEDSKSEGCEPASAKAEA
ncbi:MULTISPECIES: heme lyase CcmF/NrfE family subunit [unclassified Paraeggerthella]|uniref:heme lyase CcmF/NrfE family subunit n=1 Tax=Paraeggerthella TaxID=651554 RepID=UPI001CE4490C|nr:cytochrome c biogenesis protein CcsA [Paraeggerthella sp. Marseille-Q4926]MDY3981453.1 cytochrome c biogenesis protein CcsA [Paraeggerthella sp.]